MKMKIKTNASFKERLLGFCHYCQLTEDLRPSEILEAINHAKYIYDKVKA